jgi:hypothetical protein
LRLLLQRVCEEDASGLDMWVWAEEINGMMPHQTRSALPIQAIRYLEAHLLIETENSEGLRVKITPMGVYTALLFDYVEPRRDITVTVGHEA